MKKIFIMLSFLGLNLLNANPLTNEHIVPSGVTAQQAADAVVEAVNSYINPDTTREDWQVLRIEKVKKPGEPDSSGNPTIDFNPAGHETTENNYLAVESHTYIMKICNKNYADRLLHNPSDRPISMMMPCTITVYENENNDVVIATMKHDALGSILENFSQEAQTLFETTGQQMEEMVQLSLILLSGPHTRFETAHPYANNEDISDVLTIPGASSLTVTINGETENNYDKVYITDASGVETVYMGSLNESFTVEGDHIIVRFTSDGSVVEDGVVVEITEPASNAWVIRDSDYENNMNVTQKLAVDHPTGNCMLVDIEGETENNYDFITITNNSGTEIAKLSGPLSEAIEVHEGEINVNFTSDGSVTKEGFTMYVVGCNDTGGDV